jgi:5-methylcytosine-specific restriction endonuclease McrA
MTMIDPPPKEPVEIVERRRLRAEERRALLDRQQFVCAACPTKLTLEVEGRVVLGAMVDEHIIPLALGGSNDLTNRELRCPRCAKEKTTKDIKAIYKAARIRRRLAGEEPRKRAIRSRGFRRDPLSWRKLDGS